MKYDVFISCKSEDYNLGREVFEYLSNNRISAFMADKKLRQLGMSDYGRVIDEALDNSKHLILVTSSVQNVMPDTSPYVYYEWHTFSEEKKSGRKNGNIVLIVTDLDMIGELPIALRNNQTFHYDDYRNVISYITERFDEREGVLTKLGLISDNSIKEIKKLSQDKQLEIHDQTDKKTTSIPDIFDFPTLMEDPELFWDDFIYNIIKGEIVPVIGAEYLKVEEKTLNQYLLDGITKAFGLEDKEINSFSDLESRYQYRKFDDKIRWGLRRIWEKHEDGLVKKVNTDLLEKFLSLPYFPCVLTTTVDPVVERILERIHGNKLKVIVYNGYSDIGCEIRNINHLTPTLIYMYGKIGINGNFVITNDDLRKFVKSWLSGYSCPKELLHFFKTHTFLFLGYNYRGGIDELLWQDLKSSDVDSSTYDYIHNIEKGFEICPDIIMNEIVTRLDKMTNELEKTHFDTPKQEMDIYLSYSRADSDIAEELYKSLTSLGKHVWYDKKNLERGGFFEEDIRHAIESADFFIPILSNNIVKEKGERHFYRKEWMYALEKAKMFGEGHKYIIPMVEKGFDYRNARVPKEFGNIHPLIYSRDEDFNKVVEDLLLLDNSHESY